ncbi:MAG: helix-turn-helix transcriptional regulator [Clostridia bacterium]|nr:helix-turn-helix transcriptional regulator [Clostridia bacterium]
MTLGQKIKTERKNKKITQEALCAGRITRNMLSEIENDKATPSLDTLRFLALSLELPMSYLVSESDDLFFYKKSEKIASIKSNFNEKKYKKCIESIKTLEKTDDELSYILAVCYFELGKQATLEGSLKSAMKLLTLAKEEMDCTIYRSDRIECLVELYLSLAMNIKSPLLELDTERFEKTVLHSFELDFYKFITGDMSHNYSDRVFSMHIAAKQLIKERKYIDALAILREIESAKNQKNYNAYLVLTLYTDMETCFKQLADFENAYKYSAKRMTLIDQFNN